MGFDPKTAVFERAKTVHALDRTVTMMDAFRTWSRYFKPITELPLKNITNMKEVKVRQGQYQSQMLLQHYS
jgi:hypothetical protein